MKPIPLSVTEILLAAAFTPYKKGDGQPEWERKVGDLNNEVSVIVKIDLKANDISLTLSPGVRQADLGLEHLRAAEAAKLAFKLADKLAEAGNGVLMHQSTVNMCRIERNGESSVVVAHYPDEPFRYDGVCLGYRLAWESRAES